MLRGPLACQKAGASYQGGCTDFCPGAFPSVKQGNSILQDSITFDGLFFCYHSARRVSSRA
jgi:hypothetical protein